MQQYKIHFDNIKKNIENKNSLYKEKTQNKTNIFNQNYDKQKYITELMDIKNEELKIDELIQFSKQLFKKYQWIIGGDLIHDNIWCESDKKFLPKNNSEIKILYNSIESKQKHDTLTADFLNLIKSIIHRKTNKYLITYKFIQDKIHNITWIIFVYKPK